jgi:hypothetical protein
MEGRAALAGGTGQRGEQYAALLANTTPFAPRWDRRR